MQRIINRILLLIIVILLGLLIYKTLKPVHSVSTPLETSATKPDLQEFSQERIELVLKDYLMNNPQIIVDAVEQLQKRKMQEMDLKVNGYIQEQKTEIEDTASSPIIGNDKADVTIVTFYDYNCSYCKKADRNINEILAQDSNVKEILRPFPILGEASAYAAKIALAVNALEPAKFKDVHEGLMRMSPISKEAVESLLTELSIDLDKINTEIEKVEIKNAITKNFELARNLRIQGAPAFIINGKLMPGLLDVATLKEIIAQIRAATSSEDKK